MRGYFRVNLTATTRKRTGEQMLLLIEKALRKDGIEFVEDCDGDTVIVRYGEFTNDIVWDAYHHAAPIEELVEV